MDIISGLGRTDPLHRHAVPAPVDADDDHDDIDTTTHPAAARVARGLQPERVRRVQRRRPQLRIRRDRQLPDVDHDAATCHDHHCRAHWTDITRTVYDTTTGRITA